MLKHSCRWVIGTIDKPAYCEKKVQYHMVEDGGEPGAEKVRKYDPFCPMHMKRAEEIRVLEEQEED